MNWELMKLILGHELRFRHTGITWIRNVDWWTYWSVILDLGLSDSVANLRSCVFKLDNGWRILLYRFSIDG